MQRSRLWLLTLSVSSASSLWAGCKSAAEKALDQAWSLSELGQAKDAEAIVQQHLAELAKNWRAHWLLGRCRLARGDNADALQSLEAAVKLGIESGQQGIFDADYGLALAGAERWAEAAQRLRNALDKGAVETKHKQVLAQAYLRIGRFDDFRSMARSVAPVDERMKTSLDLVDRLGIVGEGDGGVVTRRNFSLGQQPPKQRIEPLSLAFQYKPIETVQPTFNLEGVAAFTHSFSASGFVVTQIRHTAGKRHLMESTLGLTFGADAVMFVAAGLGTSQEVMVGVGGKTLHRWEPNAIVLLDGFENPASKLPHLEEVAAASLDAVEKGGARPAFVGKFVGIEKASHLPMFYAIWTYLCPPPGPGAVALTCCLVPPGTAADPDWPARCVPGTGGKLPTKGLRTLIGLEWYAVESDRHSLTDGDLENHADKHAGKVAFLTGTITKIEAARQGAKIQIVTGDPKKPDDSLTVSVAYGYPLPFKKDDTVTAVGKIAGYAAAGPPGGKRTPLVAAEYIVDARPDSTDYFVVAKKIVARWGKDKVHDCFLAAYDITVDFATMKPDWKRHHDFADRCLAGLPAKTLQSACADRPRLIAECTRVFSSLAGGPRQVREDCDNKVADVLHACCVRKLPGGICRPPRVRTKAD